MTWSAGLPSSRLGITQLPCRTDSSVRSATCETSVAMSIALLPIPTTSTLLPRKSPRSLVVERVQLLAVEVARVRRVGPLRHLVVAVGDHEHVEALALAVRELELPAAVGASARARTPAPSRIRVAQPEALGVVLEVAPDGVAARVVRRARRASGARRTRCAARLRDQVQRAVGGGRPRPQRPHAADARAALEGDGVEAARGQRAQGGQPRGPGSDDRETHAASP